MQKEFPIFVLAATPVMIAIMLGSYLLVLKFWDMINARIELRRAVKEAKRLGLLAE